MHMPWKWSHHIQSQILVSLDYMVLMVRLLNSLYTDTRPTSYGLEHSRKRGDLPTSSNFSSTSPSINALASAASENGQSSSNLLWNPNSSVNALRHEDAGVVPCLGRSDSGRLPPAYNPGWEAPPSESSRLIPGPESQDQAEESSLQITADSGPSPRRTKR
jgi:hypothetical protein